MDTTLALFGVLGFLAVVLSLEGLYNLWTSRHGAEARRLAERLATLGGTAHTEVSLEKVREQQQAPRWERWLTHTGVGARAQRWIASSGTDHGLADLMAVTALLAVAGLALPLLLGQPLVFGLTLGLTLAALPWLRVSWLRDLRIGQAERQFPEALDMMSRAMRAGHSFPTAVRMVGDEMAPPMGKDFRILADEVNYGIALPEALSRLADRVPVEDVRYFVVAVTIQRESGGNLTELLDNIAALVRARLKLRGEVRTLSAEGRLSAYILIALPFVVAWMMTLVNPAFMQVLWTDPLGRKMVGVALFAMVFGVLWMRRIIRIHV